MRYRALAFALLFSAGVHVAFFLLSVWFVGGVKGKAVKLGLPILAVLVPVAERSQSVIASAPPAIPETRAPTDTAKQLSDSVRIQKITESHNTSSSPLVFMADALDAQPLVIVEPAIEPDYGFADDVAGQVVLGLLLGSDGSVVWVGVESSEVDQPTTDYLVRAFENTTFQAPIFRGRPVYALLRVEVSIPSKTTESRERGLR